MNPSRAVQRRRVGWATPTSTVMIADQWVTYRSSQAFVSLPCSLFWSDLCLTLTVFCFLYSELTDPCWGFFAFTYRRLRRGSCLIIKLNSFLHLNCVVLFGYCLTLCESWPLVIQSDTSVHICPPLLSPLKTFVSRKEHYDKEQRSLYLTGTMWSDTDNQTLIMRIRACQRYKQALLIYILMPHNICDKHFAKIEYIILPKYWIHYDDSFISVYPRRTGPGFTMSHIHRKS